MRRAVAAIAAALSVAAGGCGGGAGPAHVPDTGSTAVSAPTSAVTPAATSTPNAARTPEPGWTAVTTSSPPMVIALPLGWAQDTSDAKSVIAARSSTQGSLFVIVDPSKDLNAVVDKTTSEYLRITGQPSTSTQVSLPAGPAMKVVVPSLAGGSTVEYVFPAEGDVGVVQLSFLTIDSSTPPDMWDQIAAHFNPYGTTLP